MGCSLSLTAVDVTICVSGLVLLLGGDLLDCWCLRRPVRYLALSDRVREAEFFAAITGTLQALSLSGASALYFFLSGAEANLLFVIGALGIGAVNSAIALPLFPLGGMIKLGLYGVTPVVLIGLQAIRSNDLNVLYFTDTSGSMLLICMAYMFMSFTKSGLANFRITQTLGAKESELKRANQRMVSDQKELRKLSLVARKANDSIVLTDPERRIIWVNEAFSRVTGFSAKEAVGQKIAELLSGDDESLLLPQDIDEAVGAGKPFRGEMVNITKDNRRIWVEVNIFPVHDASGEVEFFVGIERDVTEAKKHAEEMVQARHAAEQGARAKSEFLANMSHEIRTPLTGIIGMTDILAETGLSEEQKGYLRTIAGSSQSLMTVINDVLDLSQLDAGKMELNPAPFRIDTLFQDTVALLTASAKQANTALSLEFFSETSLSIDADQSRLRQVAINLIGNAIKFTKDGDINIRVEIIEAAGGPRLKFEVKDTGIGIAKNKLDKIFDRFTQAERDTVTQFGGTGLGLTISRNIIELMGGRISVTSKLGLGTTFLVDIPVKLAADLGSEEDLTAPVTEDFDHLAGLKILIAEDNQTNRLLLSKYLDGLPIFLRFAADGVEAVSATEALNPDLIFMDVSMPGMSGLEATRQIRRLDIPQPTIVALTAHAFDTEMQSCLKAGMDHFLTKPIRKQAFLEWITKNARKQDDRPAPPSLSNAN
ncbi:Autoinducer 2 sensor kinase/phosphatase LuxQ [Pelagimonas phthalicica]|uniref:Sensory/regulatory protein RpfC n=1 Tax=Pelagimonas phthalicica TaxID=1037362 RepID=A0A238JJ73_9RHOB|nr:PAS domain-containing hybrid sensor histidine kinase/response regulator [Pelagimonas phthalicica]TDS90076.1 PAS/PAC sensor hybrid histidine kinase [Pelagimonas phthalicica]SMX30244.1 Autoinducer 2 sensor kinase/phosphatase LuxQ [Pelagimonas phthalicica]